MRDWKTRLAGVAGAVALTAALAAPNATAQGKPADTVSCQQARIHVISFGIWWGNTFGSYGEFQAEVFRNGEFFYLINLNLDLFYSDRYDSPTQMTSTIGKCGLTPLAVEEFSS